MRRQGADELALIPVPHMGTLNAVIVTSPSQPAPGTMTRQQRTLLTAIVLMGWPAAMAYAETATAAGREGTYACGEFTRSAPSSGSPGTRRSSTSLPTAPVTRIPGALESRRRRRGARQPSLDKAPTFTFRRFEPAEGGGFDLAVVNAAGNRINGIDVRATSTAAPSRRA